MATSKRPPAVRPAGPDALDMAILESMRADGRKTFADLAKQLSAPEATVRKRFQRLVRDGQLQITAMQRLEQTEAQHDVSIAARVTPGCVWQVAHAIAALESVRFVSVTTGNSDLQIAANFRTGQELLDFLANQLGQIPGIESIQTRQILRHVKRDYEFLPGTEEGSLPAIPSPREPRSLPLQQRRRSQKGALDDLDRAIMESLQDDGRRSYSELAKEINVPEATVRKRFQRLVREGYLQIIVMTRLREAAAVYNMSIAVRVAPNSVLSVAEALAELQAVRWVAIATGEADILLAANFANNQDLLEFLNDQLGAIPGVKSTQTNQVLHYVRRNYRWIAED